MTAARRLARSGNCEVTLIERGPALGGLAGDFTMQGTSLEKTYHHLFRTDSDIRALVDELGLNDVLEWHASSMGIYYEGQVYPFMSPKDVLCFTPCSFLSRIRLGVVALYLKKTRNWRKLANQSAYDWMRRMCGKQATDVVWGPLLRGKFHRYYDAISMAWLWARIHYRGNSREKSATEMLGYFRGGFSVITDKFVADLGAANVKILKGSKVDQLRLGPEGPSLLLSGVWSQFDRCLFTGPSAALAQLVEGLPGLEDYRRKLNSISYLGAITLVFATEQKLGEHYWLNINERDAPFLVFIRHTRMVDPKHYNGKEIYYIGSYQPHDSPLFTMPESELRALWFDYLQRIHPQFNRDKILEEHLFRLRYAQHVVDTNYGQRVPDFRTPVPGVYLANFSQLFPEDRGTTFSVRDGNKVANLILDDIRSAKP